MSEVATVEAPVLPPPPITPEAPVRTEVLEVLSAEATRAPLEHETPPKSSEDRIIRKGSWAGVIDGAGGSINGGLAADKIKGAMDVVTNGGSFTTKDSLGTDITIDVPAGGEVFKGKSRIDAQARMNSISTELNRLVRESQGGAACFAFGQIYEDNEGKLALTYASLGDSEIAVVKKDGKVELMPNKSVRQLAEQRNDLNLYLSEREDTWKYAEGQSTRDLLKDINIGTIDLDEGDRVVYLTDGIAEDLHNIRGVANSKGNIRPQKGPDGRMIGLDVLGKIDPKTPIDQMPQAILAKLDHLRVGTRNYGAEIRRNSSQYGREVSRKIVNVGTVADQINVIVGGKGPTTDRGYDDGETVVVAEAKKKTVESAPLMTPTTAEAADEVYDDETVPPKDRALEAIIKTLKEHRPTTGKSEKILSIIAGKRVYGLVRTQYDKALLQSMIATTEEDKKRTDENFARMSRMMKWAEKQSSGVDKLINQYAQSDEPKNKSIGIDLQVVINTQEIHDHIEMLQQLQNKLSTFPEEIKPKIIGQIDTIKATIANLRTEQERLLDDRKYVKDDNERVLPNQVAVAALQIVKVLEGKGSFSDEDLEDFVKDPLRELNKHFSEMIGNREMAEGNIKKLVDANLIKKENAEYFMNQFIKYDPPEAKKKSVGDYVLPTVGILAVLAFLMLQKAGAAEMGGGRGH